METPRAGGSGNLVYLDGVRARPSKSWLLHKDVEGRARIPCEFKGFLETPARGASVRALRRRHSPRRPMRSQRGWVKQYQLTRLAQTLVRLLSAWESWKNDCGFLGPPRGPGMSGHLSPGPRASPFASLSQDLRAKHHRRRLDPPLADPPLVPATGGNLKKRGEAWKVNRELVRVWV